MRLTVLRRGRFLKVILIDDEQLSNDLLKLMLQRIGGVEVIGTYTNPMEALESLKDQMIDTIFLDNEMGQYNGIQIAKKIRKTHPEINIVFVTAYEQFAVDAFEIRAADYLLKPVIQARLKETLNRLKEKTPALQEVQEPMEEDNLLLNLNVMGQAQLRDHKGNEMKWRTRKVKELFIYLWHHSPNAVHRTRIIEDLWAEQLQESATQLMHTTLYQLRKSLRDAGFKVPIKLINEKYVLQVTVKSDLEELERLFHKSSLTDEEIETMIHLYAGDYVEEESYSWAVPKQAQLKIIFLTMLETYVKKEMQANRYTLLVELCLNKMISLEPYNERFIYLLIDYYGNKGNLQKIIAINEKVEKVWIQELGVQPPKDLIDISRKYLNDIEIDTE